MTTSGLPVVGAGTYDRRVIRTATAALLLSACSGCGYVADRGIDFLDQYRIAAGVGSAVGVRARALGAFDTGLMFGVKPRATSIGVKYGDVLWVDTKESRVDADQAEIIKTTSLVAMDWGRGSYFSARSSAAILPAVFSWVDSTPTDYAWRVPEHSDLWDDRHWLWSSEGFASNRYQQMHAFDLEVEAGLLLYVDLGYSPGELADFLLGILTIDIAEDDDRL